jgi:AP2-like factor (ANT lineage)
LWDKNCWNESQNKKGRQVYLGAYDDEDAAAHSYDLAALKYWGPDTILNFPLSTYTKELQQMEGQSREEYIGSLRRKSSGFSRGVSKFRGVARHHHNGRWEARIGRVFGNKYLYLGTYATQEEAATAYDMAAIEYRGLNAVTNFDLSRYIKWLKPNPSPNPNVEVEDSTPSPNIKNELTNLSFFHNHNELQQPSTTTNAVVQTAPQPTTATSALGLLLQSSKFKEMMEMTSSVNDDDNNQYLLNASPDQCTFPEDIQTYFGCGQDNSYSSSFGEGDGGLFFGDLNSYVPPMFHCDFEV